MHPLLTALAVWPGRQTTQSAMEEKGYRLSARYQETVLANCGNCDLAEVDRYWDEAAREYLCSGDRANANRRTVVGETVYRSQYLDELATRTKPFGTLPVIILNDCLREFWIRAHSYSDGVNLYAAMSRQLEEHKQAEIEHFGISASGWTGTKGDFRVFLQGIAKDRGFSVTKKKCRKNFGEHLEIVWSIDSGMRRTWTFQLPLIFEISHRLEPHLIFSSWNLDVLLPGFFAYHQYKSPESAILGIQAHVDLVDAIGELISASTGPAAN